MDIRDMNEAEIHELLGRTRLGRLACADERGPYVVPVGFAYDGEAIYVHSLPGRKIDLMSRDPRVSLQIDEIDHMASWRAVLLHGLYERLDGASAERARRRVIERLAPGTPEGVDPFAPPGLADRVVMFKVKLVERHGRRCAP